MMTVRILKTNKEDQRSFELETSISVRERTYTDSVEAVDSPVASKIFGFPWARSVTVAPRSVTVSAQDWVSWDVLEEPLKDLLVEHFTGTGKDIEENPDKEKEKSSHRTGRAFQGNPAVGSGSPDSVRKIKELIEAEINPALADHGGFVNLHSVEGDKALIEMGGGCQGCAMSYMTLKEGIEEAIKKAVPGITQVIDVTNHDDGENPYYTG